jgi:hypothetical protein
MGKSKQFLIVGEKICNERKYEYIVISMVNKGIFFGSFLIGNQMLSTI